MQANKERGGAKRIDPGHSLKPLRVLIYRNGKVVRREELADPRALFVMEFNEQGKEFGLSARAG